MVRGTYEAQTSLDVWATISSSWFNAAEISFTGIIFLLQVNLVWSTRPTRAGTWRTTGVLSAAFFADCSNWVMNKMTRLMHKSMLWMSVLLVLFKGLCPSDYKWGICLTFKSWNIFRIHKVLTGYNTIGMFQEQLRVASIFTRCRPVSRAQISWRGTCAFLFRTFYTDESNDPEILWRVFKLNRADRKYSYDIAMMLGLKHEYNLILSVPNE